jgi:hypothetical protein
MTSKLSVRVEAFTPRRSNTLFGFVDVVIPELRLRIREAAVHQSHGRRWIGLPGKPQVDRDGAARRDDRGKIAYSAILQFLDRDTADAFSERAVEALLRDFPGAFDEGDSRVRDEGV